MLGTLSYAAVILINLLYLKYHTPEAKCSSLQIILKSVNVGGCQYLTSVT